MNATDARTWVVAAVGAGLGAGVVALILGGGAPAPAPVGIPDPGPIVGWGLVTAQAITRVSAVVVIGLLVTAVWLLPNDGPRVRGRAAIAVQWAGRWSILWALGTAAYYVFITGDIFAMTLREALNPTSLSYLVAETPLGRGLAYQLFVAVVMILIGRYVTSVRALTFFLLVAASGLLPAALAGHAAGAGAHDLAVILMAVHLIFVAVWFGGLAGLLWVSWRGSARLMAAARRFSALALFSVLMLTVSGLISAGLRLDGLHGLTTPYGSLIIAKSVLLVVLISVGAAQRHALAAQIGDEPAGIARFARLAGLEVVLLGIVVGVSVALSRTEPPGASEVLFTEGERLLGRPLPPPPETWDYLWTFYPSGLGLLVVGLGVGLYVTGLATLRRRGVSWPIGRTICWMVGMAVVAVSTLSGLGLYGTLLFSTHMIAHMTLSMIAPIFLVLGAPMTLALRTLPGPRRPGEVSPRKLLNEFLQSRFSHLLTHPLIAATLFVGSLYAVYFTDLFEWLMRNHWGHVGMELHFLAAGFLFYYVVIGVDPSTRRLPYPARLAVLFLTIPFHAFFAIALMQSSTILAEEYFTTVIGHTYAADLAADQYLGASITWGLGEVPMVVVLIALFIQWFRSDRRDSQRHDRSEARSNDAELAAYNAYLEQLRRHDAR